MPKYKIDYRVWSQSTKFCTVFVEANDPEDAREMLWESDDETVHWTKYHDSDTEIESIEELP